MIHKAAWRTKMVKKNTCSHHCPAGKKTLYFFFVSVRMHFVGEVLTDCISGPLAGWVGIRVRDSIGFRFEDCFEAADEVRSAA
jgi:hypothetical protein